MTTHNDESLKTCPFCAAQPKEFAVGRLYCPTYDCPAGRNVTTPEAWNRRAEQPQPAPMQVDSLALINSQITHLVKNVLIDGSAIGKVSPKTAVIEERLRTLAAALASRAEHAVPEGYVLVPVEITDEMEQVIFSELGSPSDWHGFKEAYRAMIAAAPSNKEIER